MARLLALSEVGNGLGELAAEEAIVALHPVHNNGLGEAARQAQLGELSGEPAGGRLLLGEPGARLGHGATDSR